MSMDLSHNGLACMRYWKLTCIALYLAKPAATLPMAAYLRTCNTEKRIKYTLRTELSPLSWRVLVHNISRLMLRNDENIAFRLWTTRTSIKMTVTKGHHCKKMRFQTMSTFLLSNRARLGGTLEYRPTIRQVLMITDYLLIWKCISQNQKPCAK